jgi:hypothetical protein
LNGKETIMKLAALAALVAAVFAVAPTATSGARSQQVDAEVLKRGRARPSGTGNIGVYVESRREYRRQWERFGYRSEPPAVDFGERRVVFVATAESSSCRLRFGRATLRLEYERLVIHLNDGASSTDACTDDLAPRSFVISLDRSDLPRGDLAVRIRRA